MTTDYTRDTAHGEIDHIFKHLLPQAGMTERPEQIKLSHLMFDAMLDHRIALCDAGTGIGKTYAYLVAGIILNRYRYHNDYRWLPVVISTSSIALQDAVLHEYLPFLSKILMDAGMINQPICGVIRKGKSHYVCDERLEHRLQQIGGSNNQQSRQKPLEKLTWTVDLDTVKVSSFDRENLCVPAVCSCSRPQCRYRNYLKETTKRTYLFQICNHNLLLADAMHRIAGMRPILPDNCCMVLDESHKLGEAARQMFGVSLTAEDLNTVLRDLKREHHNEFAHFLKHSLRRLMPMLEEPPEERDIAVYVQELILPYHLLYEFKETKEMSTSPELMSRIRKIISAMSALLDYAHTEDVVCYPEEDEAGGTVLWAMPNHLDEALEQLLWKQFKGIILTSGTLAVGTDFSRFRGEVGLLSNSRTVETVSPSPFDYGHNCLLYLPKHPPALVYEAVGSQEDYYDSLTDQIVELLDASAGHALILFTSYAMMEAVEVRLKREQLIYPIFTMRKHSQVLAQFRSHPGAVLLATGSAWEGMDFPGDQVSLLIIPKLPFAIRSALGERRKAEYGSLYAYLQSIVVPEMQIKLRQGFGRAIRTETDTCAVAVLDERCVPGQRYYGALMKALPEMPVTSDLGDVAEFYLNHKPTRYFKEIDNG